MSHLRKMGDVLKRKEVMLKSENEKDRVSTEGKREQRAGGLAGKKTGVS